MAISPKRLLALGVRNQTVTFAWNDYAENSKHKTMRLELKEFVRRFCLHLLPERYVKIRHFGFLGNRQRKVCVAKARELLQTDKPVAEDSTAAPSPTASPPKPMLCPYCGSDQLELIEIVEPRRADPPATLDSS